MVYLCYVITFGVFPGVSLANDSPDLPYVWFAVLLVTTFNVFDFLGRNSPALWLPSTTVLWIMTLSRFIFWFTFLMIASDHPHQDPQWIFGATWFKFLNMALFAFSNGFTSTSHMIYGPQQVVKSVRDVAGYTMATGLVLGIFSGSIIALSFTGVGHAPSD